MKIDQKIPKRYCERCGKVMNTTNFSCGFDRITGEERKWVRYTCPELDYGEMLKDPRFCGNSPTSMGHYWFEERLDRLELEVFLNEYIDKIK